MDKTHKKPDPITIRRLPPEKQTKPSKPEKTTGTRILNSVNKRDRFGVPVGLFDYLCESKELSKHKQEPNCILEHHPPRNAEGRKDPFEYDYVNHKKEAQHDELDELVGRYLKVCSHRDEGSHRTLGCECCVNRNVVNKIDAQKDEIDNPYEKYPAVKPYAT